MTEPRAFNMEDVLGADAAGKFVIDALYAAGYGACLQAMGGNPGPWEEEAAADAASKIVKAIIRELPDTDLVDVGLSITLAAMTGVQCGEELRFRLMLEGPPA